MAAYTWQLDGTVQGPYKGAVYNALSSAGAFILVQCRTGHSRPRSNRYRIELIDMAGCECEAAQETVIHVIYEYSLPQEDHQIAIDE
jgi:hypothetical protein